MSSSSRFRLWLHPVHGDSTLAPIMPQELSAAVTMDEHLSILSEFAAAQSTRLAVLRNCLSSPEVFLEQGRLVTRSRAWEELFALPIMFSLIGHHRNNGAGASQDLPGLMGVIACTFMDASHKLEWKKEPDSNALADAFSRSDVWLFVVTPSYAEEFPAEESLGTTCDGGVIFGDAIAALGRLGAICDGFRGSPFSQNVWENAFMGGGASADVALVRQRSIHASHQQEQTQPPSYAAKLWSKKCSDLDILREIRSLLRVQGHPHILSFVGVFRTSTWTEEPQWLMLMEAHARGDLNSIMSLRGAFPERAALSIVKGVLQALGYIHRMSIIHRDVKLDNVVLSDDGKAVLVDFGYSVHLSEEQNLKRKCGTPGYIAPEILLGWGCSRASDIFSCGIMLYAALSSRLPFVGADIKETCKACIEADVVFSEDSFALVDQGTRQLVKTMLRRSARERPCAEEATRIVELCTRVVSAVQQDVEANGTLGGFEEPVEQIALSSSDGARAHMRAMSLQVNVQGDHIKGLGVSGKFVPDPACKIVGETHSIKDDNDAAQAKHRWPSSLARTLGKGFLHVQDHLPRLTRKGRRNVRIVQRAGGSDEEDHNDSCTLHSAASRSTFGAIFSRGRSSSSRQAVPPSRNCPAFHSIFH